MPPRATLRVEFKHGNNSDKYPRALGLYLNSVAGVVGRQDVAGYADVVTKNALLLSSMLIKRFMDSRHSAWNYDAIGSRDEAFTFNILPVD